MHTKNAKSALRLIPAAALALLLAPPLLSDTLTLPAVTSLPVGSAASPFFSDVRVFNTSYTAPVTVNAVYRCFLGTCPATAPQINFTLAPRESRAFDDMISSAFNAPISAGAVELTASGDLIRVTSRLYSPAAGGGTNGMFVPGLKNADSHAVTVLPGLSNGLFRTNIGIYNREDSGVNVTIKLYNGTTLLGTHPLTLGPRSGTQVNRIFDVVGQAALTTTNAFAVVAADNSNAELFTYAAVIDNATADSSFVSGEEDVAAPTGPAPTAETINITTTNYLVQPRHQPADPGDGGRGDDSALRVRAGESRFLGHCGARNRGLEQHLGGRGRRRLRHPGPSPRRLSTSLSRRPRPHGARPSTSGAPSIPH